MTSSQSEFRYREGEVKRRPVMTELYQLWKTDKEGVCEITKRQAEKILLDKDFDLSYLEDLTYQRANKVLWDLNFEEIVMVSSYLFTSFQDKVLDDFPSEVVTKLLEEYQHECLVNSINENNRDGLRLVFEVIKNRQSKLRPSNGLELIYEISLLRPNPNRTYEDDEPEEMVLIDLDPEIKWIVKPLLFESIREISMSESSEAWHLIYEYFGIEGIYEALAEIYRGEPKYWETIAIGDQVRAVLSCGERKWTEDKGKRWSEEDIKMKRECMELINSKIKKISEYGQIEVLSQAVNVYKEDLSNEELEIFPENWLDLRDYVWEGIKTPFGDEFYLERLLGNLPDNKHEKAKELIDKIMSNEDLSFAISSLHISNHTRDALINEEDSSILQTDEVMDLIDLLWEIPSEQHLIAKWASLTPVELWSNELKDKLSEEVISSDVELKFRKYGWELCNRAEDKMWQSVNLGLTILIEGKLLLKGSGKKSALCLESFTSKNGFRFVKGCWYSPSEDTQSRYKEGFVTGETEMSFGEADEWVLMRSMGNVRGYGDIRSNDKSVLENKKLFLEILNNYVKNGVPNKEKVLKLEERRGYLVKTDEEMST